MRLLRATSVVALLSAYLFHVFRVSFLGLPDAGLADWLDPYFINFLLENWYQSIRTLSDPASPPWFFPVRHTLSYSHGLILYVPFYVPARLFLHPFQAYTVMLMLVIATGTICLYVIFRRHMRLSFVEAVLLSALFLTSHNVINGGTSAWSQRASVFLIPPLLLLGLTSAVMRAGAWRRVLAGVTGLLSVLLFVQDFYTGAFVLLVGGLMLIGVVLVTVDRPVAAIARVGKRVVAALKPPPFEPGRHEIRRWWLIAGVVCLGLAAFTFVHPIDRTDIGFMRVSVRDPMRPLVIGVVILGVLFVRRYNVVRRIAGGARNRLPSLLTKAQRFAQQPVELVKAWTAGALAGTAVFLWLYLDMYFRHPVFPRDQLWNSIRTVTPDRWNSPSEMFSDLLFYDSVRPFALVAVLLALMLVSWRHLGGRWMAFGGWFAALSALVLVLPLGFKGWSIWETFVTPVPGLGVIRDPRRVIYVFELVVALGAGLVLMRLDASRWPRRVAALLFVGLLYATWNTVTFNFDRPRETFREWVERPIAIEAPCRSFFMKPASTAYTSRSGHQWSLYAVDAGFLALRTSIPTLNGYSAWVPDGWGGLANPRNPEYLPSVREWIQTHGLEQVCELDIERRTMRRFE